MKLRNYKPNDFDKLEKLLKESGVYYKPLDKKEIFDKKIEWDSESIIVAEDNEKIVGTVFTIYDPWNAFVYHLGVHPDYQGQGLAAKLMDEAENRLKSRGMMRPTLFVEEDNSEVLEFYKNRGWEVLYKVFCLEKGLKD